LKRHSRDHQEGIRDNNGWRGPPKRDSFWFDNKELLQAFGEKSGSSSEEKGVCWTKNIRKKAVQKELEKGCWGDGERARWEKKKTGGFRPKGKKVVSRFDLVEGSKNVRKWGKLSPSALRDGDAIKRASPRFEEGKGKGGVWQRFFVRKKRGGKKQP